jgi:ABC-type transport system substrate-binding protein
MIYLHRLFVTVIALLLFGHIWGPPSALSQPHPKVLRVICHVATPWVIGNQVVEPLIHVDNENRFVPCLAESYQMHDSFMDLELRKGVLFQDGTPFTAESVLMNWDAYQRTADPYLTIDLRMGIRSMEALSSHQIRICFKEDGLLGLLLVYLRSFYIYSPAYFQHNQGTYPPGNQANISEPGPWGTGPFQLKEVREEGAVAVLSKNPGYWQEHLPRVSTIIVYGTQTYNGPMAHRTLKRGEADLFDAVSPSMIPVMAGSDTMFLDIKNPLSSLTTLFNMRKPNTPLRDIRVRKALNLLMDRKTLFKYVGHGRGLMTAFIFPLSSRRDGLEPYPYQPEEAKALLESAGFDDTHPLTLTIGFFASEVKLANAIANLLEEGGLRVNFQEYATRYDLYQHVTRYGRGVENPMTNETWDLNIVNIGLYTNSIATHFGECFSADGGYCWILPDPKVDALFYRAVRQRDPANMEQGLMELEDYLHANYYMMPIYISPTILAVHRRISRNSFSNSGYLLNMKELAIE